MKKLSENARHSVEMLLNTYSNLCLAESKLGKKDHAFGLTVNNEKNDSDFVSIDCNTAIAKQVIEFEKARVEKVLAKYGVRV